METWRRGILLACICLAIFTTKFAVLKPLVTVRSVDFAEEQNDETRWTEEGQRLVGLGLEEYIREKTEKVNQTVSGPAWEQLFAGVKSVDEGTAGSSEWKARVPADDLKFRMSRKTVFFRPEEAPFAEIAAGLRSEGDRIYLALEQNGATSYLEATLHVYSSDDFHFGSGFSHYPKPPAKFMFPFRKFSLFILLIGLAAYVLLPRRKKDPNTITYAGWRIILGDFVSYLLFTAFFALPFFIVGGTVQAITHGWMFCLIFWPLAFLGLWLLPINTWYAGYRIVLKEDRLIWEAGKNVRNVLFSDIENYRPLVLTAPRWLVWASAAAAMGGRGSARIGASGRALLLAGSAYGGMGIKLKDGSSVFVWVTDAMGTGAMKNSKRMIKMLESAGVNKIDEPEAIQSVAVPTGRDRSGKILKQGNENLVWILAGLPVLAMVIFFLIVMFGRAF
ncbi:MAG: hypothetical protein NTW38_11135 [Candidatus Aminicenantes bacterium]|nr:hypothetical protein [Candidatus Aminicenantes bacterium]